MSSTGDSSPQHPIGVVSRRTGIPPDVLRAWERRYEAVSPGRAGAGRRLYSDADVERLRLLKLAVDGGRRISDVAGLSRRELQEITQEDAATRVPVRRTRSAAGSEALLHRCLQAVETLDAGLLAGTLERAEVELTRPRLREELLLPLMVAVGRRWAEGTLRVAHEHLATTVVRSFLGALQLGPGMPGAPGLVVACPPGQRHELGALLAADAAHERGWQILYLGADTPVEDIAAAAIGQGARAIALSLTLPLDEPAISADLVKLRRLVGETPILVGGQAAGAYSGVLGKIEALETTGLRDFQASLDAILSSGS